MNTDDKSFVPSKSNDDRTGIFVLISKQRLWWVLNIWARYVILAS